MYKNSLLEEKNIKKAIVEAIAFFDLFDFPMTAFEVWQNIKIKCELADIIDNLDIVCQTAIPLIQEKNGFYFLKNRSEIINTRMARYNYTDKKFKRAIKVARLFKFIPWIKMIAVGNLIGAHNLKKESDIDFFIITKANRVWITRFFCVLITKFLGLRPKPNNNENKICLSFFISEKALNLEKLMLENDIYFYYWLANLTPIYNINNIFAEFIEANSWFKNKLPNLEINTYNFRRDSGKNFSKFYYDIFDLFFGELEGRIKKLQLKIMPAQLKSIMNKDTRVVIDNNILKLHTQDRRTYYLEKYNLKIKNL